MALGVEVNLTLLHLWGRWRQIWTSQYVCRASELPGFMEMSAARFMCRAPHWGAAAGFFSTLHVVPRCWLHLWTLMASQDIGGSMFKWSEASLCHCHWTVWWKALLIFNNPKCKSKPNRWTFHPKTSEVQYFHSFCSYCLCSQVFYTQTPADEKYCSSHHF